MNIEKKYLSLDKKARPGKILSKPKYIIIHWIGPFPNQSINDPWKWWENGVDGKGTEASAHFVIKDNDVLKTLPTNEVAWHAGDSRNYCSIGIEVIPNDIYGEFSNASIQTLKELITYLKELLGPLEIVRHFDGEQKKRCPEYYVDDIRWQELLSRIS